MRYGQIAGNASINANIYRCFDFIHSDDQKVFVRKFREQPHEQEQVVHTYRELVLGAFLASKGLRPRYERALFSKTPDWSLLDNEALRCIIELINFHVDRATQDQVEQQLRSNRTSCYFIQSHAHRLYQRIQDKASAYKQLVNEAEVPFVIALFGDFAADVELREVEQCVLDEATGIFPVYPEVSGLLFFDTRCGQHHFTYMRSPEGARAIDLPSGVF